MYNVILYSHGQLSIRFFTCYTLPYTHSFFLEIQIITFSKNCFKMKFSKNTYMYSIATLNLYGQFLVKYSETYFLERAQRHQIDGFMICMVV